MTSSDSDIALHLMEQEVDDEDISEIFHENTKYWPSIQMPLLTKISNYVTNPQLIERSKRGRNYFPTLTQEPLENGPAMLVDAETMLKHRRSVRTYSKRPIELSLISGIMYHALHANHEHSAGSELRLRFRPYPSAGALYPIEFYVAALRPGTGCPFLAHYDPDHHTVAMLRNPLDCELFHSTFFVPTEIRSASLALILTSVTQRSTAKYGPRGYRFSLLEAGHAQQNACLVAAGFGLGSVVCGGYYDDKLNTLLDLDGVNEAVVSVLFIGHLE